MRRELGVAESGEAEKNEDEELDCETIGGDFLVDPFNDTQMLC